MRDRIINIMAFAVLGILWIGFIAALAVRPETLNGTWLSLRSMPWVVQGLVWLLALPVVLGLWIWHMSWPAALRLVLVFGLAFATVYTFFPRKTAARAGASASKAA